MEKIEDALVLCKFGRFHYKLLLATLLSVFATTVVSTTTSYLLPSAECDLDLTILQKGVLNAIPFLGELFLFSLLSTYKGTSSCTVKNIDFKQVSPQPDGLHGISQNMIKAVLERVCAIMLQLSSR